MPAESAGTPLAFERKPGHAAISNYNAILNCQFNFCVTACETSE